MGIRLLKTVLVVTLAVSWCGAAVAAPPDEPPGKSGEAPGHQKKKEAPEPETPPTAAAVAAVEQPVVDEAPAKPEKPEKPKKPEKPDPAKPELKEKESAPPPPAPPPASVSAPGASGPHKVTICHKGHAITVDVHAARAHIDGHGDTYAPAGSKGRAACGAAPAPPQHETPNRPAPVEVAKEPGRALVPATAEARTPTAPARVEVVASPRPAPPRKAVEGAQEHQATLHATLPFTGRSLPAVVLLALSLVAAGALMRARASRRAA